LFFSCWSLYESKQGSLPKHVVLGAVPKGFWNSHTVVFDIQGIEIDRFLMNILVTFFVDVLQTKFDCFTDKLAWAYSAVSFCEIWFCIPFEQISLSPMRSSKAQVGTGSSREAHAFISRMVDSGATKIKVEIFQVMCPLWAWHGFCQHGQETWFLKRQTTKWVVVRQIGNRPHQTSKSACF